MTMSPNVSFSFVINIGYFGIILNTSTAALLIFLMRKIIKVANFKDFDTMFYKNILTVPFLALDTILMEDWTKLNIAFYTDADTL